MELVFRNFFVGFGDNLDYNWANVFRCSRFEQKSFIVKLVFSTSHKSKYLTITFCLHHFQRGRAQLRHPTIMRTIRLLFRHAIVLCVTYEAAPRIIWSNFCTIMSTKFEMCLGEETFLQKVTCHCISLYKIHRHSHHQYYC